MDTERIEALASLIGAETERRLLKEIIGDLSKEERAALREKVIAHMCEGLKSGLGSGLEYSLKVELETGLKDHIRKCFNEKYAESLKRAIEASLQRYLQPSHLDKIVDTQAPLALSTAVKQIIDRVARTLATARIDT